MHINLPLPHLYLTHNLQERSQASSYYSMFHHDPLSSLSSSYGRSCGVASQSGTMGMVSCFHTITQIFKDFSPCKIYIIRYNHTIATVLFFSSLPIMLLSLTPLPRNYHHQYHHHQLIIIMLSPRPAPTVPPSPRPRQEAGPPPPLESLGPALRFPCR